MRTAVFALAIALAFTPCSVAFAELASSGSMAAIGALDTQQPSGQLDINVDVNRDGGAWYTSPVWIAIGVLALIVLVLLVVMATRGGGTTIVKE